MDWVRLALDVDAFDEARFAPYLQACQVAGIEFHHAGRARRHDRTPPGTLGAEPHVLRGHPGPGRSRDLHWLRTFHHPRNVSAIAMNRRLGFVDEDPHRCPS